MNRSTLHPELQKLADADSKNYIVEWLLFISLALAWILVEWFGLKATIGERLLYYSVTGALLFALAYSLRLYRRLRFRRLSWLLYNTQPIGIKVMLRPAENDNEPCFYADIETGRQVSTFPSLAKGIWVDIPDWDASPMLGNFIAAQCYINPKSKRCSIIGTEKGLLITEHPF